jgi:uncharacterized membrane protein YgdD (TMEM256/DUF423 family)
MCSLARRWIAIGAIVGAIGVSLGAIGAHGLDDFLRNRGFVGDDLARRLDIFDTAIHYQMLHALALVLTGLALQNRQSGWWRFAGWAFLFGVIVFCGLLKVLTIAGAHWNWLGMVVPFGGVSMIVGWLALAIGTLDRDSE